MKRVPPEHIEYRISNKEPQNYEVFISKFNYRVEGHALSWPKIADATERVPPEKPNRENAMKPRPSNEREIQDMVKKILPERKTPVHMPILDYVNRSVIVFLTLCTEKRKPILAHPDVHTLLINAWKRADAWKVGHYIIMPDHVHLFCASGRTESSELKRWIRYWKAISSRTWPRPYEQPVWQKSFWDTQLRRGESYSSKWEYIRENPIRAGLCALTEDWPFQGEMEALPWYD